MNAANRGVLRQTVTGWQLWRLPPVLRWYVCGLIAAWAGAASWVGAMTSWRTRDVAFFVLLTCFGAVAIELARRIAPPEPSGFIKEVYAAWLLPVALLLPSVYALAAPVITFSLLQWRTRRTIAHRRVFSAAASGLTLAAVSITFHSLPTGRPLLWLLAATVCAVIWQVVIQALVIIPVWLSDRTVSIRRQTLTSGSLLNDVCELAAGVLLAGAIARIGPVLIAAALPLVLVLHQSFRRTQLQSDTRIDSTTGLLTAIAWRAEAEVQLARAQRNGSPLAIGILTFCGTHIHRAGMHPARDPVLTAAATTIREGLRPYDLTGQLTGKEITFLLPSTTADEARQIAERLHTSLGRLPAARTPGPAQLSIAIGIAATNDPAETDLADLLRAADVALHQAKQPGHDHVCLTLISAENPGPATPTPDAHDEPEAIAEAWRALGHQLRLARERAQLTQRELERRIPYARSTIATAERGRPYSAEFWAECDHATGADGAIKAGYARIQARIAASRKRAAQQELQAHGEVAELDPTDAHAVCPDCGALVPLEGLKITAQITAVHPQHN